MSGIDAGCVRLRLGVARGRVSAVTVASERPVLAPRLRGRAADEAVRLVPLLFALCGKAQGRAAELALAAARGADAAPSLDPAIQAEALREHLWRWLLDLPPLLGAPPLRAEFVAAAGWIMAGQREALAGFLAAPRVAALCAALESIEELPDAAPRLLPPLDAQASRSEWPRLDAEFCLRPAWRGAAAETGALARRGKGGGTAFSRRWRARLDELRDWAAGRERVGAGGTASAVTVAPGCGRALVDTARGLLMHEIVLDGGRVAEYFIVAPTEWNFHPAGPLPGWLLGREAGDRAALEALAARAVATLDPCVRWELAITGE